MTRPLPKDREKALAAIAAGWGREATAAHPHCTCTTPAGTGKTCPMHSPTTRDGDVNATPTAPAKGTHNGDPKRPGAPASPPLPQKNPESELP